MIRGGRGSKCDGNRFSSLAAPQRVRPEQLTAAGPPSTYIRENGMFVAASLIPSTSDTAADTNDHVVDYRLKLVGTPCPAAVLRTPKAHA